jgi:DNA-directed RNA polymerase subunit RPC12/RpoP
MARKKPFTPRSRVRGILRGIILRSRERLKIMKDAGYKCADCGAKQSAAKGRVVKVQCHHDPVIDLEPIIDAILEILKAPQVPLCTDCHDKIDHEKLKKENQNGQGQATVNRRS